MFLTHLSHHLSMHSQRILFCFPLLPIDIETHIKFILSALWKTFSTILSLSVLFVVAFDTNDIKITFLRKSRIYLFHHYPFLQYFLSLRLYWKSPLNTFRVFLKIKFHCCEWIRGLTYYIFSTGVKFFYAKLFYLWNKCISVNTKPPDLYTWFNTINLRNYVKLYFFLRWIKDISCYTKTSVLLTS